jgi:SAM-dependent methyltransferase
VDETLTHAPASAPPERIRQAEITVMEHLNDWIIYVVAPTIYDAQPFHAWDSNELLSLTDFSGKTVVDVGSGTGRQAFTVAPLAQTVFAVEPVGNLRRFMKERACNLGLTNVYPVDGLLEDIPFPDGFADVTMSGHAYGDDPARECQEMVRVTKPGGMVILCPGTGMREVTAHEYLVSQGFAWSVFEEPRDGLKRKYWKIK